MNSISLDDPDFFKKVNAERPDLFDQKAMAKNIEEENAKKRTPTTLDHQDLDTRIQKIVHDINTGWYLDNGSEEQAIADIKELIGHFMYTTGTDTTKYPKTYVGGTTANQTGDTVWN